jgi:hypothetical protein
VTRFAFERIAIVRKVYQFYRVTSNFAYKSRQERDLKFSTGLAIFRGSWGVMGVVLVAGVLRLVAMGEQSFWHDEALTVESARAPLSGIIDTVRNRENCPPAYFVLINLWAKCFGISDVSLRLPSALMGIATVWAIYRLGRELGGEELVPLTAAGMLAVSKFHIAYSQEARPYAMLMLLLTLCVWAWVRVVKSGSKWAQVGYVVSAALALYTHTFALFSIAVLIAAALVLSLHRHRQILDLRRWVILHFSVVLLFAPWIPATREVAAMGLPWMLRPTPVHETYLAYAGGVAALVAYVMLIGVGMIRARGWKWVLLGLVVVPVVAPVMYGVFVPRYGIGALIGMTLLAGYGASRGGWTACIAAVVALGVLAKPQAVKADFRSVASYLVEHGTTNDVRVNRTQGYTDRVIDYYLAGRGPARVEAFPAKAQATVWLITNDPKAPPDYKITENQRLTGVSLVKLEPVATTRRSD